MKKKILFMLINMNIGGTEKALLNMITEIPRDQFDITILMLEKYGGFLDQIPSDVNVQYIDYYQEIKPILNDPLRNTSRGLMKKGKIIKGISLISYYIVSRVSKNKNIFFNFITKKFPNIEEEYDIAVAYAGPMDFISYFVLEKIHAKKKIQWIHFDITKIGFDKKFANKNYKQFNKTYVVSNEAKDKLINLVPNIYDKTEVMYNIVSPKVILEYAKLGIGFKDNFNGIRILTVGRLTSEKGQDLAVNVLAKLIEEGYNVRWYCLGDGNSRSEFEKLISDRNLQEHFILLGSDPNPYPYINQCDIYVQPSRHEGYCITLYEARILYKPIVTTNFVGAKEQIKNNKTGLIVEIDQEEIYKALKTLLMNKELSKVFSNNLIEESCNPQFELHKIANI
ncbi:glycosyl transferase [Salipaludibacillus keqinensis]|uniref:Glycosyl transferase n=1 Tax=Salipaludibacillus keqinensis TaxID=2045207 RepID=A0A323TKG8_9BACI|nr:glycosyltransferase [Salipaludibacillus keqinensis]PYZ95080.1 glycosyl transferase [Salipaludibacillus keqinensis]